MKKLFYLAILIGLSFVHETNAQAPVGFPDGITVGTGATIPIGSTYKMAIAGGIITEKIRVATNGTPFWADFVFDKNYHLRPLSEVESFIKTNKHLPKIPSTSDVTKNGIDLAETQALLLQKVEELTLYVIEHNKKIERLEKKVKRFTREK
jgi:hypothetical protein